MHKATRNKTNTLDVVFLGSSSTYEKCPTSHLPEYAFIGRSNVGKSSLINAITNRKNIAKVSSKPGKTQLINHFKINDAWCLVDLPGYGYSRVSKHLSKKWRNFTNEYILKRDNLYNIFVLVDSNIPPQRKDIDYMNWLGTKGIAFSIVFTKIDKLRRKYVDDVFNVYRDVLEPFWETMPPHFFTSSMSKSGVEDILLYINRINHS